VLFCFALDKSSSKIFKQRVKNLRKCFPHNVLVVGKELDTSGRGSLMEALETKARFPKTPFNGNALPIGSWFVGHEEYIEIFSVWTRLPRLAPDSTEHEKECITATRNASWYF